MTRHIELQITESRRADVPQPNGNFEVFMVKTYRVAGVGPDNLSAFQAALAQGGAEILEREIGIPGLLLAQLGFKTTQPS